MCTGSSVFRCVQVCISVSNYLLSVSVYLCVYISVYKCVLLCTWSSTGMYKCVHVSVKVCTKVFANVYTSECQCVHVNTSVYKVYTSVYKDAQVSKNALQYMCVHSVTRLYRCVRLRYVQVCSSRYKYLSVVYQCVQMCTTSLHQGWAQECTSVGNCVQA